MYPSSVSCDAAYNFARDSSEPSTLKGVDNESANLGSDDFKKAIFVIMNGKKPFKGKSFDSKKVSFEHCKVLNFLLKIF